MAKIILNVELVNKQAVAGLTELQKKVKEVADSLIDVKPNKDLTAQIKALSEYYKSLASAAQKANKAQAESATTEAKMAKAASETAVAKEKAAQAIEKTREATEKANQAATKAKKAEEDLAAATARKEAAQIRAAAAAEKQAQSNDKLAESTRKAENDVDNMRIKLYNMLTAISNIEKRYPTGTFDELKADIQNFISQINELDKTDENFVEDANALKTVVKTLETMFAGLKAEIDHTTPSVDTLGSKFGDLVERYAKFYASSMLVRKPLELIQNALGDVGETLVKTEDAVIELNRVLNDPQPTQEAANRLYDLAYQYGSTFENASTIAANFARSGKSWNDSLKATEAALLAMNVAELNATEASDGLLSIIAQFDMEAGDLIDVVDKLNKTADKNPVSTQKLLQAIQRAGSAAKNANVSFDQTLGLITAISEATNRSGQNIGTAINSLIQYSTKNVDVFATLSKESEEMVDKFKTGMASIVDVWQQVAIDIHNDKESRDNIISALGTDGLEELSSTLHDELGDLVSEIDGVYNVANTYRKNYFIALLDNMDRFMDVQAQLTDYQGYSQEENAKYMDTYTAKVNQLRDAWQKLANDEQGILQIKKDLVEFGISTVKVIDGMGGIKTAVLEISSILGSIAVFFNAAKIGASLTETYETLKNTVTYMKDFGGAIERAAKAQEAYNTAQKIADEWLARGATEAELMAAGIDLVDLNQKKAAASAAMWQAALGWISIAVTAITLLATGINAYAQAQEKAREEAISLGKETAENAKQISELRRKMEELNPQSEEYRKIEEQIVDLLGDKKALLEGLIPVTEKYKEKVKELADEEINEAYANSIIAKAAATKNALNQYNKSIVSSGFGGATAQDSLTNAGIGDLYAQALGAKTIEEEYKVYKNVVEKIKELKKGLVRADAEGNEELSKGYQKQISDLQKFADSVSESMEEYGTSIENYTALTKLYFESNIKSMADSMQVIPAVARMSQAELQAIADEMGMTLEEVQEAYSNLGKGVAEAGEQAEEAAPQFDKAKLSAEEFTESISSHVSAALADAKAIEAIREAQREFAETGTVALDTVSKLAGLGDEWVAVLFDENGALDANADAVRELIAAKRIALQEQGYSIDAAKEEADAVGEVTDKLKDYSAQIDEVQSSLSTLDAIQKEYDETGSLSIDTLQKILDLGAEYIDLLIDENGQISLNTQAVETLKEEKKNLIDKLIEENTAQYALSLIQELAAEKEKEVGKEAGNAALGIGTLISQLMTLKGESGDAVLYLDELRASLAAIGSEMGVSLTQEELDSVISKSRAYYDKLHSAFSYTDTSGGWQSSSGSSGSSSGSTKDAKLEELKSVVSLRESELTLMEHQGATQDAQIAKIREIQSGLSAEADYLRSIGASQEDINKLSSEWWKWQEKINKFGEDAAKAAQKAAEEQKKAAEDAAKAAQKAAEEARKAEEERIRAETARKKQDVTNAKAALTLMEKQGKSVSERVEKMKEIQNLLHIEAEWLRQIKAEQADIDALSAEWWDWQEKILKLYKETLDAAKQIELEAQQKIIDGILKEIQLEEEALDLSEKRLAVDKARSNLEEAIAKAKLDYIQSVLSDYLTALDDAETLEEKMRAVAEARERVVQAQREAQAKSIIDAFKAEKDVKSDTLSLEEKRLAVERARQALADAENDRTTRVFNEASGQWEYQANAKNVQSAQDSLKQAIDALNAYAEEQAWNEVAEAVENGSVSEAEVLEILAKWAAESYGNGTPEFVAKIQAAFRKAMGTAASPDSVSGQISAVDNAIKALNDYLKQQAVRELKEYIAAGNTDAAGMRSIMDRWLSMGEGGELYQWRDGLLSTVTDAIESNYYDDAAVQSQVQAVENAVTNLHDYLRNQFIKDIENLVKNGTAEEIRDAIEVWSEQFDMSETDRDWANRLADARENYDRTESNWNGVTDGQHSDAEKQWVIEQMKENSRRWWMAPRGSQEQKDLEDLNLALGTSMGWERRGDGHWYDANGEQVYDRGGILRGRGGIKATGRPEAVLDPDLTAKILQPRSEEQFRAFADAMHLMFEKGPRTRAEMPVIRTPSVTDSHNTSYTVNGIPVSTGAAERYTIAELFRMMPTARA